MKMCYHNYITYNSSQERSAYYGKKNNKINCVLFGFIDNVPKCCGVCLFSWHSRCCRRNKCNKNIISI